MADKAAETLSAAERWQLSINAVDVAFDARMEALPDAPAAPEWTADEAELPVELRPLFRFARAVRRWAASGADERIDVGCGYWLLYADGSGLWLGGYLVEAFTRGDGELPSARRD